MGLFVAAISGAVGMSLEVVAFRLYAPYFGYSIYVWGSMISVVMLALALGYSFGGRLADRSTTIHPLSWVTLASAAYQLVIVFAGRAILAATSGWGDFRGTFAATLIIFAPPMAALACAGPFVIRLRSRKEGVGTTAGVVYSVSTAGSMLGTLGASFVLLPSFGTHATLEILCFLTAIAGVVGIVPGRPQNVTALIPFALLLAAPQPSWSGDTVWTAESGYNLVRVARKGGRMMLMLNTPDSVHTVRSESSQWTGFYYDDFALGPLLAPSRNVLVLGMGGGGSIHAPRVTAPDANIDAVEIDSKVVEAAERFFDIRSGPNLRIHVADARPWLARSNTRYDLVHVDLYHGGPYIPFYLATT